ncbi:MAG: tetratricopeptide repeat protein, partial [Anaerolineaceae bacterium]|nr:tetratricopeptide repeat protein [Anaerolineaceae bacterium]
FYMEQECPAHALQAAKRARSDHEMTEEGVTSLNETVEEATAYIQSLAAELGLPFETMQRACIFHEQALLAIVENNLFDVDHFSKEAIKIAPSWNAPHNNRAQALYFLGKTSEAIAVAESVQAREAEDIFSLHSLILFHLGLEQPEKAHAYADQIRQLSKKIAPDDPDIDLVITDLALVEDTPALWKIARQYLQAPSESFLGRSWNCLAVAAVRSGKWKEALKLIEKANVEDLSAAGQSLSKELNQSANQHQPRLTWMPPAYPSADQFFHPKVMAEWEALVQSFGGDLSPSQQRRLGVFFQKYPFMVTAMKRLLWDEGAFPMALQVLRQLETPETISEIYRFALSDAGSRDARLKAILALIQSGHYSGPKIVKIWHEELAEWRELELNTQRIGDIEANAQPKTLQIIERARKTKNLPEAIALLRKAVELEPTSPIAIFNLGVILTQNGSIEEGEALIYRSVEVDPNYTFGHASIALTEAGNGNQQAALDHLQVVTRAEIIAPDTAVLANLAWVDLSIQKNDLETARQRFDMASQIDPEHRLLESYERMLKQAEDFKETFGFILDFQRKSAQRTHQKLLKTPLSPEMGLLACLETCTKDMLVGAAHFLQISSSGKKAELAAWLAKNIVDPELLQRTLDEDLGDNEREALQWLLETGGIRPWKDFIHKYGDDLTESIFWNHHEPKSLPGRLRRSGLIFSGTLDKEQAAFIPADVRPLLSRLLNRSS